MKLQIIDAEVVAAAPRPLRLTLRPRPTQPSGNWVINSRRVMGLTMLRIAFGVIWAVDASLKWQPAFQANFQQILSGVAKRAVRLPRDHHGRGRGDHLQPRLRRAPAGRRGPL